MRLFGRRMRPPPPNFYTSIWPSFHVSICHSIYTSICLTCMRLFVRQISNNRLFVRLFMRLSIFYAFICPYFMRLLVSLFMRLFVCLFMRLFAGPFAPICPSFMCLPSFVRLFVHFYAFILPPFYASICPSIYAYTYLSNYLSVLCVYLSVH